MGMWTGGADVDGILMDFYLPILPIKTIYKVTYPLYILVRNRVMTSTLTVLIASVYSIIKGISTEDLLLFVFWWMIITLFFMIQIMWSRNISSLLLGRYKEQMGGKILLFVGALIFTLLVLFPIFAMGAIGWWACVISILFEIVMLVVLLYLSVVLYNSLEKIKKEDNLL